MFKNMKAAAQRSLKAICVGRHWRKLPIRSMEKVLTYETYAQIRRPQRLCVLSLYNETSTAFHGKILFRTRIV